VDELEVALDRLIRDAKRRDTIAAVLIATSFFMFGIVALLLLDVIVVPDTIKGSLIMAILLLIWIFMAIGIYFLVSQPLPKTFRIVADSSGVVGVINNRKFTNEKIYVPESSFRNLPPNVAIKANLEVVRPPESEVARFRGVDRELAEALAVASILKAKYLITQKKIGNKVNGVKIVNPNKIL